MDEMSFHRIYKQIIGSITENYPLYILTTLSIFIAGISENFENIFVFQFSIVTALCFFSALIASIIKSFIGVNILIDSFIVFMIIIGFIFFAGIIGVFIESTWGGNVFIKFFFSILSIFIFVIFSTISLNRYDYYKKENIRLLKIASLIQLFLYTVGTTMIIIGLGGQIISMFEYILPSLFIFFSKILEIGIVIFCIGFVVMPYPFYCSVEREHFGIPPGI